MKVWPKHSDKASERLEKCLRAEQAKFPLLHPIWQTPLERTQEILDSAEPYLTRMEIREILMKVINN